MTFFCCSDQPNRETTMLSRQHTKCGLFDSSLWIFQVHWRCWFNFQTNHSESDPSSRPFFLLLKLDKKFLHGKFSHFSTSKMALPVPKLKSLNFDLPQNVIRDKPYLSRNDALNFWGLVVRIYQIPHPWVCFPFVCLLGVTKPFSCPSLPKS